MSVLYHISVRLSSDFLQSLALLVVAPPILLPQEELEVGERVHEPRFRFKARGVEIVVADQLLKHSLEVVAEEISGLVDVLLKNLVLEDFDAVVDLVDVFARNLLDHFLSPSLLRS